MVDDEPIKCFVISLASAGERRAYIEQHLTQLQHPFEFIDAVDGQRLSEKQLVNVYDRSKSLRNGRGLSVSEIGCALSHLKAYRKMADEGIGHALILEDDVSLESVVFILVKKLSKLYEADDPVLISLGHVFKYLEKGMKNIYDTYSTADIFGSCAGAYGYFLNLAAAKRMLIFLFPVWTVADNWPRIKIDGIVPIKAIIPYVIKLHDLSEQSLILQRGEDPSYDAKGVTRFFRRYVNLGLTAYLYRRFKELFFKTKVKLFDKVLKQSFK